MEEFCSIAKEILASNLEINEIQQIVDALTLKKYLVCAILPQTPSSETFEELLERYWNYDTSPYVKEKLIVGQSIHRRYTKTMLYRARKYWIPRLGKKCIGSITKDDIKNFFMELATKPFKGKILKAETVNQILRVAIGPLKWAYKNSLIKNDCFSGILYCHVIPAERLIPTIDEAKKIFSSPWKNSMLRLANLLAMCTGMRIGEIQALQIQDIGKDRIYIRHNWANIDGLKCPKNGEKREVKIPLGLSLMLFELIKKNPFGQSPKNFVFYGLKPDIPCKSISVNKALKIRLKELNIAPEKKITFHSWRHFFSTVMADKIDERKLCLATGHKSLKILEHYAAHKNEVTLSEIEKASEDIFLPILSNI